VPRISSFYGIAIAMYYREHGPPHFHALYGEHEAAVAIESLEVIAGFLPPRALRLVRAWARVHREELAGNWQRALRKEELQTIEPLP
jgi:Domain of unknown function (DUF4160)